MPSFKARLAASFREITIIQGLLVAAIAQTGWQYVFYLLVAAAVAGFLVLLPPFIRAWKQKPTPRDSMTA